MFGNFCALAIVIAQNICIVQNVKNYKGPTTSPHPFPLMDFVSQAQWHQTPS